MSITAAGPTVVYSNDQRLIDSLQGVGSYRILKDNGWLFLDDKRWQEIRGRDVSVRAGLYLGVIGDNAQEWAVRILYHEGSPHEHLSIVMSGLIANEGNRTTDIEPNVAITIPPNTPVTIYKGVVVAGGVRIRIDFGSRSHWLCLKPEGDRVRPTSDLAGRDLGSLVTRFDEEK